MTQVLYLFDIDGTLLDAGRAGRRAFDRALVSAYGWTDASQGIAFGGRTDPWLLDAIALRARGTVLTDDERTAFYAIYLPLLVAELAEGGARALPGATTAMDFVHATPHAILGIATGNIRAGAEAKLARVGLHHPIAVGGYGCDAKERAHLVGHAIARAQATYGALREVIVIGDTVHDLAAARANQATAIAVTTGSDHADALASADEIWPSLEGLPAWHAARFG